MGLRRDIYNDYKLIFPPSQLDNVIPKVSEKEIAQCGLSMFPKVTQLSMGQ